MCYSPHVHKCLYSYYQQIATEGQRANVKPYSSAGDHSCGTHQLQSWALLWHQEKTGRVALKLLAISRHKASGHSHQTFTSSS